MFYDLQVSIFPKLAPYGRVRRNCLGFMRELEIIMVIRYCSNFKKTSESSTLSFYLTNMKYNIYALENRVPFRKAAQIRPDALQYKMAAAERGSLGSDTSNVFTVQYKRLSPIPTPAIRLSLPIIINCSIVPLNFGIHPSLYPFEFIHAQIPAYSIRWRSLDCHYFPIDLPPLCTRSASCER
jgi:hypothetical protein